MLFSIIPIGMPGTVEIVIFCVIAVLLFGRKIPVVARDLGSSFIEFKRGLTEGQKQVTNEVKEIKKGITDA